MHSWALFVYVFDSYSYPFIFNADSYCQKILLFVFGITKL